MVYLAIISICPSHFFTFSHAFITPDPHMMAIDTVPFGRFIRAIITPHFQRYYCTPKVIIRPVPRDNNTSLLMIIRLVPSMINCHYNAFVVLLLPAFFCFQYHSATAAIHLQEFFNVLFPLSLSGLGWGDVSPPPLGLLSVGLGHQK